MDYSYRNSIIPILVERMFLRQQLILSMLALGFIVIVGMSVIFRSSTGVKSTADLQKLQVQTQNEAVVQLKNDAGAVIPALQLMNKISELKTELSDVQYAFANASLTMENQDLVDANTGMDALEPKILELLRSFPEFADEASNVKEAFWASRVYGNKMNEFLLMGLTNITGDMAVGLSEQMDIIVTTFDQLSAHSVKEANSRVENVVIRTNELSSSAQAVSDGVEVIVEESSTVLKTVFGVGLIVFLMSAGVAYFLSQTLNRATHQVVSALSEISKTKDLALRINRKQRDELGVIAHDVDAMMGTFEEVVRKVALTAESVGHEINLMSDRGGVLENLISGQQNSLQDISASVTEMSASANEVANNAATTASTTQKANEIGQTGTEVVSASIRNIENLSQQLNISENSINQLAEDVASIGSILEVIESIAGQINLLALNAAIEAARAGEQGRGFSVVADEVRSLAGRTQTSTVEIRKTIENLQKRTAEVVDSMHQSISISTESVNQGQQVKTAIQDISGSLSEILDLTMLIASAAQQQSVSTADITERVNLLSNSSLDVLDLAVENKKGGSRMSVQGHQLNEAISIFHLG